jgi:hypothetical protein
MLSIFVAQRMSRRGWTGMARDLFWLAGPIAMGGFGLLLYNKLRFDSWFEFGTNHQLSTMKFRASWSYVAANLYSYFLRPTINSCQFPFMTAPWDIGAPGFPPGFGLAPGYSAQEPVAGILRVMPWSWLVPVGIFSSIRHGWRKFTGLGNADDTLNPINFWCASAFAIIALVTGLPVVGLFIPTMRYLADVAAGIVLFATWSAWSLYRDVRQTRWLRWTVVAITALLSASTIVFGLLLGFTGYNGQFALHNPPLHDRIVKALSRCDAR